MLFSGNHFESQNRANLDVFSPRQIGNIVKMFNIQTLARTKNDVVHGRTGEKDSYEITLKRLEQSQQVFLNF